MNPEILSTLYTIGATLAAFFAALYGISQNAAKQISQNEATTLARMVKFAASEESDEGSNISSVEAIKIAATAAEAILTP